MISIEETLRIALEAHTGQKELDRINTKHAKALEMIIKAGYENCN